MEGILLYCGLNQKYGSYGVEPFVTVDSVGKTHDYNLRIQLHSPQIRMPRLRAVVIAHAFVSVCSYLIDSNVSCVFSNYFFNRK